MPNVNEVQATQLERVKEGEVRAAGKSSDNGPGDRAEKGIVRGGGHSPDGGPGSQQPKG